jgi:hypothetical protein
MRPAIPTTAQPSSGIFAEWYRKLAQKEGKFLDPHFNSLSHDQFPRMVEQAKPE